jgi:hypothetical protein
MKIAIGAGLFAKWNMYINTLHQKKTVPLNATGRLKSIN